MGIFAAGALKAIAKTAFASVAAPFVENARTAALDAAQDAVAGTIMGKMSIEEWAEIVIQGVDTVKARVIEEGNLRYVGGKLKFATSASNDTPGVTASFELYFLDEVGQWYKADADHDLPASKFTAEALDELKDKGAIYFEVE